MDAKPADLTRPGRGYAVAMLAAAILSTTAVFIRHLTRTTAIPALVLAFWRDLLAVATLLPVLALRRPRLLRVPVRQLPFLAVYGLVLALFNAGWTLSVALNGAAVATVLVYSSAGFTALLGRWLLRERFGWAKLVAVLWAVAGCALVSGGWQSSAWRVNAGGIAAGLLAGLFYAFYSLMGRAAAQRGIGPWTTLLFIFCFATLFLAVANLLPGGMLPGAAVRPADFLWLGGNLVAWTVLLALAAGPTVAGFGLYLVSLQHLPSSTANLILTSEPLFTAATAYVLLGERLVAAQVAGGLLILGGVVLLRLFDDQRTRLASE